MTAHNLNTNFSFGVVSSDEIAGKLQGTGVKTTLHSRYSLDLTDDEVWENERIWREENATKLQRTNMPVARIPAHESLMDITSDVQKWKDIVKTAIEHPEELYPINESVFDKNSSRKAELREMKKLLDIVSDPDDTRRILAVFNEPEIITNLNGGNDMTELNTPALPESYVKYDTDGQMKKSLEILEAAAKHPDDLYPIDESMIGTVGRTVEGEEMAKFREAVVVDEAGDVSESIATELDRMEDTATDRFETLLARLDKIEGTLTQNAAADDIFRTNIRDQLAARPDGKSSKMLIAGLYAFQVVIVAVLAAIFYS